MNKLKVQIILLSIMVCVLITIMIFSITLLYSINLVLGIVSTIITLVSFIIFHFLMKRLDKKDKAFYDNIIKETMNKINDDL